MPPHTGPTSKYSRVARTVLAEAYLSRLALMAAILAGCSGPAPAPTEVISAPTVTSIASAPARTLPAPAEVPPTATLPGPVAAPVTLAPPTPTSIAPAQPATSRPPVCTAASLAWRRSQDSGEMVCVPAGEFLMGSADSDPEANYHEKPQHTVHLDAFWIDRTEVTNAQYNLCVKAGARPASQYAGETKYDGDRQPVVGVSWYDATAYCRWAGAALPTEAQWEKAARGTNARIYPWGSQAATCDYAVMNGSGGEGCGSGATWPVGSKPKGASPYGALDMAGNVSEWVVDGMTSTGYTQPSPSNPTPPPAVYRVLRGGSYSLVARFLRCARRGWSAPDGWNWNIGFRCALGASL